MSSAATQRYDTVVVSSADRISGTPTSCIIPLSPSILISETEEIILQSFSWIPTSAGGIINTSYNAIPFQENTGAAAVALVPSGSYAAGGFMTAVASAMTSASPNSRTYTGSVGSLSNSTVVSVNTGTFKFLWASGPGLGLCAQSQEISYAMGYGIPNLATDTALASSQTSPSIVNISGPMGFILTIGGNSILPTGVVTTSGGKPGTFYFANNFAALSSSFVYNNAPFAGRLRTTCSSGIGVLNGITVNIQVAENYPPYPLSQVLNDWRLVFIVHKKS